MARKRLLAFQVSIIIALLVEYIYIILSCLCHIIFSHSPRDIRNPVSMCNLKVQFMRSLPIFFQVMVQAPPNKEKTGWYPNGIL